MPAENEFGTCLDPDKHACGELRGNKYSASGRTKKAGTQVPALSITEWLQAGGGQNREKLFLERGQSYVTIESGF